MPPFTWSRRGFFRFNLRAGSSSRRLLEERTSHQDPGMTIAAESRRSNTASTGQSSFHRDVHGEEEDDGRSSEQTSRRRPLSATYSAPALRDPSGQDTVDQPERDDDRRAQRYHHTDESHSGSPEHIPPSPSGMENAVWGNDVRSSLYDTASDVHERPRYSNNTLAINVPSPTTSSAILPSSNTAMRPADERPPLSPLYGNGGLGMSQHGNSTSRIDVLTVHRVPDGDTTSDRTPLLTRGNVDESTVLPSTNEGRYAARQPNTSGLFSSGSSDAVNDGDGADGLESETGWTMERAIAEARSRSLVANDAAPNDEDAASESVPPEDNSRLATTRHRTMRLSLERMIEEATADHLDGPDTVANVHICDEIDRHPDLAQVATETLLRRLDSYNPKVIELALILCDVAIRNCSRNLLEELGSPRFLFKVENLATGDSIRRFVRWHRQSTNRSRAMSNQAGHVNSAQERRVEWGDEECPEWSSVRSIALSVVQRWGMTYRTERELAFSSTYRRLRMSGEIFPDLDGTGSDSSHPPVEVSVLRESSASEGAQGGRERPRRISEQQHSRRSSPEESIVQRHVSAIERAAAQQSEPLVSQSASRYAAARWPRSFLLQRQSSFESTGCNRSSLRSSRSTIGKKLDSSEDKLEITQLRAELEARRKEIEGLKMELCGARKCVVCLIEDRDTLLFPCKHLVLCAACYGLIAKDARGSRCPTCRADVCGHLSGTFLS